ncbi:hypothetical protein BH09PSE4_BH09PSE4_23620 [soil metagenome]
MIFALLLQAAAVPAATPAAPPVLAPWALRSSTNPANGAVATSSRTMARDGSSRLLVRCDKSAEAYFSIQFIATQQLAADDGKGNYPKKSVSMRFDGGPAIEFEWDSQGNAVYVADPASFTALTIELAKAKVIEVSTTNVANFGIVGTFDGPPSAAPISAVLAACGYTLGEVPMPAPAK